MEFISQSPTDTENLAVQVLRKLMTLPEKNTATVFALKGDLGSGKTTFSQFLGKRLGVKGDMQSPTFVLMKRYPTFNIFFDNLYHIDAYRIEQESEMRTLGFEDLLRDPKNILLIEWPEKIEGLIPEDVFTFTFRHGQNDSERLVEIPEEFAV